MRFLCIASITKKKKNEQINKIDCNFSIEQFIDIDDALASATLKM